MDYYSSVNILISLIYFLHLHMYTLIKVFIKSCFFIK